MVALKTLVKSTETHLSSNVESTTLNVLLVTVSNSSLVRKDSCPFLTLDTDSLWLFACKPSIRHDVADEVGLVLTFATPVVLIRPLFTVSTINATQ